MKWNDEYWPLLVKIYKNKPEGVKPLYSKPIVETALHLHIPPQELHRKMQELRKLDTPNMQKIWNAFSKNPKKLNNTIKLLLEKEGYGTSGKYYDGIVTKESWEKDFRPLDIDERLTPVHLILILDLYFQLTPTTMVADTVDIQDLGKLINIPVSLILEVMETFKTCDPYLSDELTANSQQPRFYSVCMDIWNRYGNNDIEALNIKAGQLKEWFKK